MSPSHCMGSLQQQNEGYAVSEGHAHCSGTLRGSPKQPGPQLLTATAWQALAVKLVWHDCCPDGQVSGAAHLHIATQYQIKLCLPLHTSSCRRHFLRHQQHELLLPRL